MSMAGGAGCGKSVSAAKIALIFWLSDPRHNTCIVASTTIDSLESRIWGYVAKFISASQVELPILYMKSKPPKITHKDAIDKIHGMFAVAIRQGEDNNVLSTLIGRHPDKGIMVVLDEATDMHPAIVKALPNLEQGVEFFQLWAIGNSHSKHDLHGAISTPKVGWDNIDWKRDDMWETVHKNSICLYFNPYKSPAITDPDPERRIRLGKFLITKEGIADKVKVYGEESDAFARFVLGFWRGQASENVVLSEQFVNERKLWQKAEFSGTRSMTMVAGLDPAFQKGGVGCVLRFAVLGQHTNGKIVLDYRGEELLFRVNINPKSHKSSELQIAEYVAQKLREFNCPLNRLAIDCSGIGRALGELIRVVVGGQSQPIRIVSTNAATTKMRKKESDIITTSPSVMWLEFRKFIENDQIFGLDTVTIQQLGNRIITLKGNSLQLEPKSDFINRMAAINPKLATSPDEADSAILAAHSAVISLGFYPGQSLDILLHNSDYRASMAMKLVEGPTSEPQNLPPRPRLEADFLSPLESLPQILRPHLVPESW